jgi:uncharacterized cupredoxin-like copper-binding protein
MQRNIIRIAPIAILAAAALSLAACGSSSSTSSTAGTAGTAATSDSGDLTESTPTSTTPSAGATALTVVMSDYAFTPKNATAAAGPITITAPNQGKLVHELVLIRTDLPLAKLPTDSAGDVNEDAFPESKRPGEISETQPGATGKVTVTLPAGRYVMLCNVAGHYKQGMVGNLVVR